MSIKAYIDTNVYLNALENRDDNISKEVIIFLEKRAVQIYLNDLSIINIHYITRKSIDRTIIKNEIKNILSKHELVSIDKYIIQKAFDSDFNDFEDGVQYFCAQAINADFIITNNPKDFESSQIKVFTPQAFYDEYISH